MGQFSDGTWLSGTNGDPEINARDVQAFCGWRERKCDIATSYTDRRSWSAMTRDSDWLFDNFSGFPGRLVISQGLTRDDHPEDLVACARGDHDEDFQAFGRLMVQKNRADAVVRLGWEFNGDFMPWSATDTEAWIACYRNAALAIRSVNASALFDWTVNSKDTPAGICDGNSLKCYPGDDVVDIVGIDNYDMGPSATSRDSFRRIAAARDGLDWLLDFARDRGKPFAVGEWGISPGHHANTSGENPPFIRWMHEWFVEHAADLAYEAYFNHCEIGEVQSNLYRPAGGGCVRQNTEAASLYRSLWSGRNTGSGDPLKSD